jgi:hypothetical protein
MQSTGISSSDIEEEIYPTNKINYALLVHDQDKPKNSTKLSRNKETKYPKLYLQLVRFLDNTKEDSEIVPGSKYYNRTVLRVSIYHKIKYCKSKTQYRQPEVKIFSNERRPIVRFNIHVPTVLGDFPINRHVQETSENLNTSNVWRNINDPKYFPHRPSQNDWYERQKREPNYKIDTYTEVRPQDFTAVRRGSWRDRAITVYQHQQTTTNETNQNGKVCRVE